MGVTLPLRCQLSSKFGTNFVLLRALTLNMSLLKHRLSPINSHSKMLKECIASCIKRVIRGFSHWWWDHFNLSIIISESCFPSSSTEEKDDIIFLPNLLKLILGNTNLIEINRKGKYHFVCMDDDESIPRIYVINNFFW